MTPKFGQKLHQIDLEIYISFIEAKKSVKLLLSSFVSGVG